MRERTLGVVDIGSNTVHLLGARTNGRIIVPMVDESEGLRLGEDVDYGGVLSWQKLQALIATLRRFQEVCGETRIKELHLLATQAIRMAANREEVCDAVAEATGLAMEVLSPEREAAFAFLGADADCPSVGPQVVVDIGGGSMQVAVGQNGDVWDSVSLPLGAARVSSHFLPSDPPTYLEEAQLVTYLNNVIPSALPLPDTNVTGVLGTGGTLRRMPPMLNLKTGEVFPADGVECVLSKLRGRPAVGIAATYGLKPERASLLFPAILVLREVLRGYGTPPIIMSSYGLREGAILHLARRGAIQD